MSQLLDGVRVIEMANVISGPYAGMLLADFGAEVIKVELPEGGDPFRGWGSTISTAPFAALNRGKKSVALDVKTPAGRDAYLQLCATADVIIENFRPGVLDGYGVGYEAISSTNRQLVYCSITGMGSKGPYRDAPTFDSIAQGMSGLWSQLTDMAEPQPVGPAMADHVTGLYAAVAVLGGLVKRHITGEGRRVEVSMLGAAIGFQHLATADFLIEGTEADMRSRSRGSLTFAFLGSDQLPFTIHLSSRQKFWTSLLTAIGRTELADDPRFSDRIQRAANYTELRAILSEPFSTRTRDEWLDRLRQHGVPSGPINTVGEALTHPQVEALDLLRVFGEGDRAVRLVGCPIDGDEDSPQSSIRLAPPGLGEHTLAILGALGIDDEHLAQLGIGMVGEDPVTS